MSEQRQVAVVNDYDGLIKALRARADELMVTREGLDRALKTLPDGYASKLLAPVPIRHLGRVSLGPMLQCLGLKMVLVEDLAAIEKISSRMEKRAKRIYRMKNAGDGMPAKKRKRKRLKGNSDWGRLMRARQILLQGDDKRSRLAQRAARVRWRDNRRARRERAKSLCAATGNESAVDTSNQRTA